ncbi:MAG: peptide-methionine (R)-S-oxide reductase MsrB [Christensenellales bacterium]|jgi:peptide methionine sulfoxide reductase msrA/msrB
MRKTGMTAMMKGNTVFMDKAQPTEYERPPQDVLKDSLTPLQYRVTQEAGTEPPFDNAYWQEDRPGIYVDIVTGEPLFSSRDKYRSSCGWPAFCDSLDEKRLVQVEDRSFGMLRIEVRSSLGDTHLGHVFENDPESPNGTRYCINSAALRFIPMEQMEQEGYGRLLPELE